GPSVASTASEGACSASITSSTASSGLPPGAAPTAGRGSGSGRWNTDGNSSLISLRFIFAYGVHLVFPRTKQPRVRQRDLFRKFRLRAALVADSAVGAAEDPLGAGGHEEAAGRLGADRGHALEPVQVAHGEAAIHFRFLPGRVLGLLR